MAVGAAKIKSAGAAQSPLLGFAMFSPAVLYIVLLIGAPFLLAIFYAFSDARIGGGQLHYVGLENFRSILQSPSFQKARKEFYHLYHRCPDHCAGVLEHPLHRAGKDVSRPRAGTLSDPAALGGAGFAGHHRMEVDTGFHLQRDYLGADLAGIRQSLYSAHVAGRRKAGHGICDPGALLALDSVFHGDPAGRHEPPFPRKFRKPPPLTARDSGARCSRSTCP